MREKRRTHLIDRSSNSKHCWTRRVFSLWLLSRSVFWKRSTAEVICFTTATKNRDDHHYGRHLIDTIRSGNIHANFDSNILFVLFCMKRFSSWICLKLSWFVQPYLNTPKSPMTSSIFIVSSHGLDFEKSRGPEISNYIPLARSISQLFCQYRVHKNITFSIYQPVFVSLHRDVIQ